MSSESPSSSANVQMRDAVQAARDDMTAGRARIAEMHEHGLNGLQVYGTLTSLLDDPVRRHELAQCARAWARSQTIERNGGQWERAFRDAITRARRGPKEGEGFEPSSDA